MGFERTDVNRPSILAHGEHGGDEEGLVAELRNDDHKKGVDKRGPKCFGVQVTDHRKVDRSAASFQTSIGVNTTCASQLSKKANRSSFPMLQVSFEFLLTFTGMRRPYHVMLVNSASPLCQEDRFCQYQPTRTHLEQGYADNRE